MYNRSGKGIRWSLSLCLHMNNSHLKKNSYTVLRLLQYYKKLKNNKLYYFQPFHPNHNHTKPNKSFLPKLILLLHILHRLHTPRPQDYAQSP